MTRQQRDRLDAEASKIPENWHVPARWAFRVMIQLSLLMHVDEDHLYETAWGQIENKSMSVGGMKNEG